MESSPDDLSPAAYLEHWIPKEVLCPPVTTLPREGEDCKLAIAHRFHHLPGFAPHEGYLKTLHAARFNRRFTVPERRDPKDDTDKLAISYCTPVSEVANRVIFNSEDIPKLRAISGLDEEHPTFYFISSRKSQIFLPVDDSNKEQWHMHQIESPNADDYPNWDVHSKCFAVAKFMVRGSLDEDDLKFAKGPSADATLLVKRREVHTAFDILMNEIQKTNATFGILTDEITSFVVEQSSEYLGDNSPATAFPYFPTVSTSRISIPGMLANYIYNEAFAWSLARYPAPLSSRPAYLQSNAELQNGPEDEDPHWLSDFPLKFLKSSRALQKSFLAWHGRVSEEARRLSAGDAINFETKSAFKTHPHKLLEELRSQYPSQQFPEPTAPPHKRPINKGLTNLLGSQNTTLSFTIQNVLEPDGGRVNLSPVLLGRVEGCNDTLCVKLYDERYFDVPGPEIESYPLLDDLSLFSEDLVRREESIYNSLSQFQGTLIAHSYGFHMFTMPDGWECYGLIMERIEGESLEDFFGSDSQHRSALEGSLISQIRHGVRILRSKGITKSHWHTGQILCQKDNSNIYAVFIGFSFATMLYDYSFDEGVPMTEDLGKVSFILKRLTADQELLDEHWLPPCDFEL